ncbi:MAG TPA: flagellar basal body L-ring protein FlgH [Novosphingobium sp.]|nr:flagellar basal body L-ring protein FlgH [Novosphingobium sp.]
MTKQSRAARSATLECFATLAMTLALIGGPTPALAKKRPQPGFEATLPQPAPASPVATGGIFNASLGYAGLYEGTRARRVGDPLTILLLETTTSSKSVNSKNQKSGGIGLVPPTTGPFSFLSADALKASSNSSFNGGGNAGQTSTLASTLSVTIAEVRPNGTALVKGEKRMLLSQGEEWVQFSGIVRLSDIDEENRIMSTRVADARIEYSGKGALQQASKQGWLGRFFNMISPF